MSSPNMNMRPYIGDESGIQLVPEPSRLMGSARSTVECSDIPSASHGPHVRAWPSHGTVGTRAALMIWALALSALSGRGFTRLIGVERVFAFLGHSAFLLFHRHKFHPAFRAISRLIGYDFGMHRAGVFLLLLLLACRAGGRRAAEGGCSRLLECCAIAVWVTAAKCARDYGCNVFSHFVWL